MGSILVGAVLAGVVVIALWGIAGHFGLFDYIGNKITKIENFFKEDGK